MSDPGAVIQPGEGCTAVDAHTARCSAPPTENLFTGILLADAQLADLDDAIRFTRRDTRTVSSRAVRRRGAGLTCCLAPKRAGNSAAASATTGFSQHLTVGTGFSGVQRRRWRTTSSTGGEGIDALSGRNQDGATGEAAPGPDLLDGGGEPDLLEGDDQDTVSYQQRTAPVSVSLRSRRGGAQGERDVLRDIESITGGHGKDRLAGNDHANVIDGQGGRDRLTGRGGDDRFLNGRGPNELGDGDDLVESPASSDFLARSCERVTFDLDDPGFDAYPTRVRARSMRYRIHCQVDEDEGGVFPARRLSRSGTHGDTA